MFLENDKYDIHIRKCEDFIDIFGVPCLKCAGKIMFKKKVASGKSFLASGFISSILLYGDKELLEETKNRLWGQTVPYPTLKLHMISVDLEIYSKQNRQNKILGTYYNLYIYEYDFCTKKYGTKQKNKKKLKYAEIAEEVASTNEFILE